MIRPQSDPTDGEGPQPPSTAARAWHLVVTLEGSDPPIWRRIAVDEWTTLSDLHRILQVAMGWLDVHLWAFEVGEVIYEELDMDAEEGEDAMVTGLGDLGLKAGQSFLYRYDFGDDWVLVIEVEGVVPVPRSGWLPWIFDGERAGPPEDVGGIAAFLDFLEILADEDHPEHEGYREWIGEDYDPELFDLHLANSFLALAVGWGAIGPEPWLGDG